MLTFAAAIRRSGVITLSNTMLKGRVDGGSVSLPFPSAVLCGALLLGVFLPSSIDGGFRPIVDVLAACLAAGFLLLYHVAMPWPTPAQLLGAAAVAIGVLIGTATSPFKGAYSPGLVPAFCGIALLITARPFELSTRTLQQLLKTVRVVGGLVAVWVAGLILGVAPIQRITVRLYPAYYAELVPFMVADHRPVTSWGTHSVAAFFYFLLVIFFRHDYLVNARRLSFALAVFYVGAMFGLRSLSGLALGAFAVGLLIVSVIGARRRTWVRIRARRMTIVASTLFAVVAIAVGPRLAGAGAKVLEFNFGGFSGRYNQNYGRIYPTIKWLQDHPFRPIGFTESNRVVFGDSGPVDYFLRGSMLTLLGVYAALIATLRNFLPRFQTLALICAALLLFELGFSALPIWRLQLILVPFLLALRALDLESEQSPRVRRKDFSRGT